jgi:class 3 adenylate cyclase
MAIIRDLRRVVRSLSPRRDIGRGGVVARTFVCGDVASFAPLTQRLGDTRALDTIQRLLRIVLDEATARGGRDLEVRGDGFLLAFRSAPAAIRCSVAIQRALEVDRRERADDGVELRMAVHNGEVLRCGTRFFGRNLIVAFRLLDQAEPGEILVSSPVRPFVPHSWRYCLSVERSFQPRGLASAVRFARVDWARTLPDPSGFLGDRARPLKSRRAGAANRGQGDDEAPAATHSAAAAPLQLRTRRG